MSFLRHLSAQWLATGYVGGVSLLLSMVLGRLMGPDTFGVYNYVLSLAAIYGVLQDGGFRTFVMREKAAASLAPEAVETRLVPMSLGHLLTVTVLGTAVALVAFGEQRWAMALAVAVTGGRVFLAFVSAYLRGLGAFGADALWQAGLRSITALTLLGGWLIWETAEGALAGWLAGQGIGLLLPAARRYLRPPRFNLARDVLRTSLAFLTIDAFTALYFRIDIVLLEHLTGDSAVTGTYAAAYRLLEGIIFVLAPLSAMFFRQLRVNWQAESAFNHLMLRQLAAMAVLGLAIAAVVWGLSGPIIGLTFGGAYTDATDVLPWLFAALVFILPNAVLTQALIATDREWWYAVAALIAAVGNAALNLWLIPGYGMLGAAWATLATEGFLMVYLAVALWRLPTR